MLTTEFLFPSDPFSFNREWSNNYFDKLFKFKKYHIGINKIEKNIGLDGQILLH